MRVVVRRKSGFTLVEMMITVGIVGILASVAIPGFNEYKRKVRYSEATQVMGAVFMGQSALFKQVMQGAETNVEGLNANGAQADLPILCYAPMNDDQSNIRIPGPEPYLSADEVTSGNCVKMGFPNEALYFSYAFGVVAGPPAGTNWVNLALEDLDGDGTLDGLADGIAITDDGELRRALKAPISFGASEIGN